MLAVLQSVTIHLATNHGLGRHRKNLNAVNYDIYNKVGDFLLDYATALGRSSIIIDVLSRPYTQAKY